jgi:hypothetical protein
MEKNDVVPYVSFAMSLQAAFMRGRMKAASWGWVN